VFTANHATGGIVAGAGDNLYISKCWNGGAITGEHFVGGIVGRAASNDADSITDTYNIGSVSAVQYAGGIVGYDYNGVGIQRCYNSGSVTTATTCGAIAGAVKNGEKTLVDCVCVDAGVGATGAGISYTGVKAVSSDKLSDRATFENFDFINVWKLRDTDAMPTIKQ
jgi:hypothetical protein